MTANQTHQPNPVPRVIESPTKSPRILYFAPKECWPPSTGAQLRNFYLARELARGGEHLTYLGFSDASARAADHSDTYQFANRTPADEWCEELITVPLDSSYSPSKLARGLLGKTPLPVLNYTTPAMQQALTEVLARKDFDIVQIESVHLSEYLPIIRAAKSKPKIICDWHNVESELMQRYSEQASSVPRRFYAQITAKRMADLEKRIMRDFDAHVTVSDRDRDQLKAWAPDVPIYVIENGVNVEYYSPKEGQDEMRRFRVVFIGSMDYHANTEAVKRFAESIWPRIYEKHPELVFTVVGRNPTPEVSALNERPGIEITGRVRDVRPYCREALTSVVPLRIGGGSRLKILEAMAADLPIVSTQLGAEGIEARHGENILLADSDDDFTKALLLLCENESERARLALAGRALVESQYDWSVLAARLRQAHEESLQQKSRS
jgi:sugar transferase (PEP-CTERM/EpsH1 system associated)